MKIVRILGTLEAISYLVLLGVCMPLKYIFKIPEPTFFAGTAHGGLFVAYCLWVLIVAWEYKWTWKPTFWALLASLLPFGPFVADRKLFREAEVS